MQQAIRFRWRYAVAALLLILLVVALIGCTDYARDRLYAAPAGRPAVPEWTGEPAEEIAVTTTDNLRLAGYYWAPDPGEHDVILVLHGRRDTYSRMADYVQRLAEEPRGILVASYRGFAGNPGDATQEGLIEDARAFYREARRRAGPDGDVYVFGHSLGGAVAIQLAAREELDGLITLATFTDIDEAAPYYAEWFIPDKWRSIEALDDVAEPMLLIHGAEDSYITPGQAEALYARSCSDTALIMVDGVRHRPNFRLIGPLLTSWIDALEQQAVGEMRVEGAARWQHKPPCASRITP